MLYQCSLKNSVSFMGVLQGKQCAFVVSAVFKQNSPSLICFAHGLPGENKNLLILRKNRFKTQ